MNIAFPNETKAKIVHSSIHDLMTDFFAIFLTNRAELRTVTLYRQDTEVLLPSLIRQESWLIPNTEPLLFPPSESLPGTTLSVLFQTLHFHSTSVQLCSIEGFHGDFESPSLTWSVCTAAAVKPRCIHS